MLAVGLTYLMIPRREAGDTALRVGVGDDITALLMEEAVRLGDVGSLEVSQLTDCCGSAAQWAITSGDLDIGFYCSDIALTLINIDGGLEIYGPTIMNAEVAALACKREAARTFAIPLKRLFLGDVVRKGFPAVTEIDQASIASLHYVLAGGNVDGIVVDIAKALRAPDFDYQPLSGGEYVSYCLVAKKAVIGTPRFERFIEAYNLAVDEFNDIAFLKERYDMDDAFWQSVETKFLYLD